MARINGIEVKPGQWWMTRNGNAIKKIRLASPHILTEDGTSRYSNGQHFENCICDTDLVTLMKEPEPEPLPKKVQARD